MGAEAALDKEEAEALAAEASASKVRLFLLLTSQFVSW